MDDGYWTKFEARKVEPTKQIPHGIRYSLTLHNRDNIRILGFDNAHTHKPKRKKYGARKVTWDHKHKLKKRTIAIARGEYKPKRGEPKIWFESVQSIAQVLSSENQELLKIINEQKPESLKELEEVSG